MSVTINPEITPVIIERRIAWLKKQMRMESRYFRVDKYMLKAAVRRLFDRPMTKDAFQVMANEQFRSLGFDIVSYDGD